MNELCPMLGCRVEAITPDGPNLLHIAAHGIRPGIEEFRVIMARRLRRMPAS